MSEMPMEIYLEPVEESGVEGQLWCQDNVWGDAATKYHHDDKYRALEAEVERLREGVIAAYWFINASKNELDKIGRSRVDFLNDFHGLGFDLEALEQNNPASLSTEAQPAAMSLHGDPGDDQVRGVE